MHIMQAGGDDNLGGRGVFDGSEVSAGGVDYRPDHLSMLDIAVGAAER